jgi:hypothetical protein
MRTKEKEKLDRRGFLRGASLGAGFLGAAATGLVSEGASAAEPIEAGKGGAGYRETEHVKTYYKLARF